jgi:hypothetical protein
MTNITHYHPIINLIIFIKHETKKCSIERYLQKSILQIYGLKKLVTVKIILKEIIQISKRLIYKQERIFCNY